MGDGLTLRAELYCHRGWMRLYRRYTHPTDGGGMKPIALKSTKNLAVSRKKHIILGLNESKVTAYNNTPHSSGDKRRAILPIACDALNALADK